MKQYHDDKNRLQSLQTAIAFVLCLLNRRRPFMMFGVWWSFCGHRSHRRGLRCWRWFVYDGYCYKHNDSCYSSCEDPSWISKADSSPPKQKSGTEKSPKP